MRCSEIEISAASEKSGAAVLWPPEGPTRDEFIQLVNQHGEKLYRDLPWRGISDPYGVLVSEVMLQQTQVSRVQGRWERWMRMFPTVDALAAASSADVLAEWQGLGYNRRALALKRACDTCAQHYGGCVPQTAAELVALSGVGPATAAGVIAFAYNRPATYLETNVRSVFIHELFPQREAVSDAELIPLIRATCPADNPRAWYYALLDYGAFLKTTAPGANPSRRSTTYARQSTFEGSHRQKRAHIVRTVLDTPGISAADILSSLNAFEEERGRPPLEYESFSPLLDELVKEGFFTCTDGHYQA